MKPISPDILQEACIQLLKSINSHPGIETKIQARGKFELYLHLELIRVLKLNNPQLEIWSEVPLALKKSKKGKTIDLLVKSGRDYSAIEIKLIATNYHHNETNWIRKTTKGLTDAVDGFIHDTLKVLGEPLLINKEREIIPDRTYSIGFVYPMPYSDKHKKLWNKQVVKAQSTPGISLFSPPDQDSSLELSFSKGKVTVGWHILSA